MTELDNNSHCESPDGCLCDNLTIWEQYLQRKIAASLKYSENFNRMSARATRGRIPARMNTPFQPCGVHRGAYPCVAFTKGESRKRARSNARSCEVPHVCAVQNSARSARPFGRTKQPLNWPRVLAALSGRQNTKFQENVRHPRNRLAS